MRESEPATDRPSERPLNRTVKALGIVSFFADVSSEMVYPLNPIFITRVLGAPAWALGLIEGIAESTASLLKLYSGWLSDRVGQRKPFAVAGYGLGAIGKPMIALSSVWWHVLAARFVDRLGKGLRTAPRDALIAENCDADQRGRAFGFHRAMDTTGAVLGPLIGYALLLWVLHGPERTTFPMLYWIAFVPGLIGAWVLAATVRERRQPRPVSRPAHPSFRTLSPAFRKYLLIVGIFSLGNSSDAFLILRAQNDMGVGAANVLLLYALFNVVEAALGYPAGRLSDRMGRKPLIALGWLVFAAVYLGFAVLRGPVAAFGLFVLYGLYYTLTQGLQRAMATDLSHPDRRATEIGAFHMVVGLAALPACQMAGILYDINRALPFFLGAACALVAAIALLIARLDTSVQPSVD
jgi:MFS family permease